VGRGSSELLEKNSITAKSRSPTSSGKANVARVPVEPGPGSM
jgi:hypothetical protein